MKRVSPSTLTGASLADLAEIVRTNGRRRSGTPLMRLRRAEIVRDLERVAKVLGLSLDQVPADRDWLKARFGDWNPTSLGWSEGPTRRIRSSLKRALEHLPGELPPLKDGVLPPEWREPLRRFEAREQSRMSARTGPHRYYALAPFADYCGRRDIDPANVDEAVIDAYVDFRARAAIKDVSQSKLKGKIYAAWKALSKEDASWPPVPARDVREPVMWPLERFPESFQAEVRLYKANGGIPDADRYDPKKVGYLVASENLAQVREATKKAKFKRAGHEPISATTMPSHEYVIRRAATMLVRNGGVPVESIRSIADVITPEAAEIILLDYDARHGEAASDVTKSHDLSTFVRIAISWLHADEIMIAELRGLFKACKRPKDCMSDKQREVVDRFLGDPALTARLICLPDKIMEAVERRTRKRPPTKADALEFQSAIALMILLTMPVRGHTLICTKFSFIREPVRKDAGGFVRWPSKVVKTNNPLQVALPWEKIEAICLYKAKYRPVLARCEDNPFLFPGRVHEKRMDHASRQTILGNVRDLVYRHLGVRVHGHLWRKVLASILFDLTKNEKAVRALLGHSPHSRSTLVYVENMRTMAAAGALDSLFTEIKKDEESRKKRGMQ